MKTILFLHGFLGCKEDWADVIGHLGQDFRCIAIDLPLEMEEIIATLDRMQIATCALVGYSMGGRIALMLKERYPERFSDLALLAAHPGLQVDEKRAKWEQDQEWIALLQSAPFADFLDKWYRQPLFQSLRAQQKLYEETLQKRLKQDPKIVIEMLRRYSPSIHTPSLPQRALFLCGKEDLKYVALYRTLPSFLTVKEIANAGHALHLEQPKACAAMIKEYLETSHVD